MESEFLDLRCTPESLDLCIVRSSIQRAIRECAPMLNGTLLDIGCGHMPYKSMLLSHPSKATKYIGLDLELAKYGVRPDLVWNGECIPLPDGTIDCALATEVFEHCAQPEVVMNEIHRILKPNGMLFFTVPFLWPLHEVPHDEYRYTPFALERLLRNSCFAEITLKALGGWDASLAQMIGLWVRRRSLSPVKRKLSSMVAALIVRTLQRSDVRPTRFNESTMITGLSGTARRGAL